MFNDPSSPAQFLATRRSAKPRDLVAPGPDDAALRAILTTAARVPDHGKLAPWRFVIVGADRRDAFAALLADAYRADKPDAGRLEMEAIAQFAHQAPTLIVVLSAPREDSHIPLWEQELSAGAACHSLVAAATATGFGAGWLTGWAAYSNRVRDAFGAAPQRIAGFVFIGTPSKPLEERPRPDLDAVATHWSGTA
ncbi:nitroreductase [Sphingomonas flavalba]|uniref:nitroreductase family protein n=1 Tax=Sphingomonas flavalba TaxID=2559804 RepID=UPI0039E11924